LPENRRRLTAPGSRPQGPGHIRSIRAAFLFPLLIQERFPGPYTIYRTDLVKFPTQAQQCRISLYLRARVLRLSSRGGSADASYSSRASTIGLTQSLKTLRGEFTLKAPRWETDKKRPATMTAIGAIEPTARDRLGAC
jgi:hypothetical protein